MHLDLPTVLLLYNTSLIAGALSLLHISRHSCRPQGLQQMVAAYLMLIAGSVLAWHGEHGMLPTGLWTQGSLALGAFGYTLFWIGVRRFSGRRHTSAGALLPALLCVLIGIATDFPLHNLSRAGVFHAAAVLALFLATLDVLRDSRDEPLPSRYMLACFLGLSGGIYALQLAMVIHGTATPITFSWAFYVQMFCHFGVALAVAAMSNERAEIRLVHAALTDPLTGIGNRRWLTSRLPAQLPLHSAVMQLDIDAFKGINDRHGHAAGDAVLVEFARCAQAQLRETDLFARMGGEEFLAYLPQVTRGSAEAIAERVRLSVEALRVEVEGVTIPITVSAGLAWVDAPHVGMEVWLRAADQALYRAKEDGRNRVRIAVGAGGYDAMFPGSGTQFPRTA